MNAKELAEKISDLYKNREGALFSDIAKELQSLLTEALAGAQKQIIDGYSETKFIKEARAIAFEEAAKILDSTMEWRINGEKALDKIRRRAEA